MRRYNILGDNNGSISDHLWFDKNTAGSVFLTSNLLALKRVNFGTILTVKITEWSKFIDYFCRIIESDPSRVVKKNVYFVYIGYITSPLFVNIHISRHHIDKDFNL